MCAQVSESDVGLGNKLDGFVREDHFVITVASEIMAVLCLANDAWPSPTLVVVFPSPAGVGLIAVWNGSGGSHGGFKPSFYR